MIDFSKIFNYPIYIVGGAVRDGLLGEVSEDIDLASSLQPYEFKNLCKKLKYKTFDTGILHGTVMVQIKNKLYEHTTFRYDVSCDGRNATVKYAKQIEEDLSRRDFTINAMARLGNLKGKLIDPFGGEKDLHNKILRCVGKASERFEEDYLRIIRAARFSAKYDLILDEGLRCSASKLASKISKFVVVERISQELQKAQFWIKTFFIKAENLGFRSFIFPFFDKIDQDILLQVLDTLPSCNIEEYYMRLFFLAKEDGESLAKHYRLSNKVKKSILFAQEYYKILQDKKLPILSLYKIYVKSPVYFEYLLKLFDDMNEDSNHIKTQLPLIKKTMEKNLIDGKTLLANGIKSGKEFSIYLDYALDLQLRGKAKDDILTKVIDKYNASH